MGTAPPSNGNGGTGPYSLSSAQLQMWTLHQLDPASPAYNLPFALELRGRLNRGALARSVDAVVEAHHVLRSRFFLQGGRPRQVVLPASGDVMEFEDLSCRPNRDEAVETIAAAFARQPFDLGAGAVFRAKLVRLALENSVLLFAAHHVAFDGLSVSLFLDQLGRHYRAAPAQSAGAARQYHEVVQAELDWLAGEAATRQLRFWERRLAGLPDRRSLPSDLEDQQPGRASSHCSASLPQALARQLPVSLFIYLLGGLAALLYRWTGESVVVVGSVPDTRSPADQGLIGCFVNFVVISVEVGPEDTGKALLRKARRAYAEALKNRRYPFISLAEAFPTVFAGGAPYNVGLLVQPFDEEKPFALDDGLEARLRQLYTGTALLDLRFNLRRRSGQLVLDCEYDAGKLSRGAAEALLRRYSAYIANLLTDPELVLQDYDRAGLPGPATTTGRAVAAADPLCEAVISAARESFGDNSIDAASNLLGASPSDEATSRLLNALSDLFDISLAADDLAAHCTPDELQRHLLDRLCAESSGELAEQIEGLSEEEVDRLLEEERG